ncbi:hypothetical protein BCR35DRAFT_300210 [Leucosporidium creatinivorum]|uniref:Uncharacterized protein n=1 Tax=Leucosporidium creatinivorum TaxID=106004 RepID=A0A1Y2FZZ6_9BASI|nr:hypothetical protein BCR35DRAFT_300210 [Leucosporidium creatinivorum]
MALVTSGGLTLPTVEVVGYAETSPVAVSAPAELASMDLAGAPAVEMALRREEGADSAGS